jgi:hypothetical protein
MPRPFVWSIVVSVVVFLGSTATRAAEREAPRGKQIFYRMVGSRDNARILPKTRSVWTQDRRVEIGSTGMADEGYTEFPFCYGVMDFTFVENWAVYSRLISGAQASESHVNTADILIDHVYEPQASVWGWSGDEFIQTFTATRDELVRICLRTACPAGVFRAALIEHGPGGRRIGPTRTFRSQASPAGGWPGSTEYATVRWEPGQAPLVPGHTYGIRLWRADGKPALPYLHATGNAYDGGILYVDNIPHPESDLAMWIVEEPADLKRALIEGADEDGWVYDTRGVVFVPRTPNVRMITLNISPVSMDPPTEHNCCDLVVRVSSMDGRQIVGPKQGLTCGPVGGEHTAHFLYATDELKVTPGRQYRLDAYVVPHKGELIPDDKVIIEPRDMNARIYGEPEPGALPGIFNLSVTFESESRIKLTWSAPFACPTTVETWGLGASGNTKFEVPAGTTELVIPKLWASHQYNYRLTSVGPNGATWSTPVYQLRMPKESEKIKAETQSVYNPHLLALALSNLLNPPDYGPLRYMKEIELANNGFEEGLTGWTAAPASILDAPDVGWTSQSKERKLGLGTRWGNRMAGFTHVAGQDRHEAREQSTLTRKITTEPGHVYVLSASINTSVDKGAPGDTAVRLLADPMGGNNVQTLNADSSQWYWTGGKWMRFEHRWRATAGQSTIGFGFLRCQDLDRSSAYVDNVHVYDLGPAPVPPDAAAVAAEPRRFALIDPKPEAEDRVEAFLQAPPGYVITGMGARAHEDNITTLWLRIRPLLADGTLGASEEMRAGWDADAGLEAKVELPEGYVATGFGAGIAPEWDVKRFGVWARPLNSDGTLGEEELFRGGIDLKSGFEKEVHAKQGRVLTSAGLNCMLNDANGIKATSMALIRTATARGTVGQAQTGGQHGGPGSK